MSIFLLIGLWCLYRETSFPRKYYYIALGISLAQIIFFLAMVSYLESKFNTPAIPNFLFRHLWSDNPLNPTTYATTFPGKVRQLIKNIPYLWVMLWEPQIPDVSLRGIKSEIHLSVLLTGGWTFFYFPVFLFMLVPAYLYNLYANSSNIWSILAHYNMEFAVIIPLSVLWFFSQRARRHAWWGMPLVAIWTQIYNLYLFKNTFAYFRSVERQFWYSCVHYSPPNDAWDYKAIRKALDQIPDTARVSAITRLHPHLGRDPRKLYLYPQVVKENVSAEYIVLLRGDSWPDPLTPEECKAHIDSLANSPEWEVIHDRYDLVIFKAKKPPPKS